MKIRTDFVTNSSSSSFVTINATSKTLAEILDKYKDLFDDDCGENLFIFDDDVEITIEEGYADIPDSKENIIYSILSSIGCEIYPEDYDDDDIIEVEDEYGDENRTKLYNEILAKRKEITDDLNAFEISVTDIGWQGDSDSRYYEENYDKETLKQYYETIAKEKGCDVKDVTSQDFQEWVSCKVSTDENTCSYDKKTDKFISSHSFTVE